MKTSNLASSAGTWLHYISSPKLHFPWRNNFVKLWIVSSLRNTPDGTILASWAAWERFWWLSSMHRQVQGNPSTNQEVAPLEPMRALLWAFDNFSPLASSIGMVIGAWLRVMEWWNWLGTRAFDYATESDLITCWRLWHWLMPVFHTDNVSKQCSTCDSKKTLNRDPRHFSKHIRNWSKWTSLRL